MRLRPATSEDREWLLALVGDERIAASLSTAAAAAIDAADGDEVLVVEDEGGERAGVVCWSTHNRRSRIAGVHTVAIDPDRQGRGLAVAALREVTRMLFDERGFHRVEAETYGFNRAARRAFAAAGFVEEGIRRRAYDRHGAWQDGVHLGLLADDPRP
ncbi:MAG TPA: GNAT family N-acetyltransferase [Solirubrobacteraceae bacterium]|jgi:aminoglycoside 6'-N-acetyltransferase|nr:GNAT family N-acetyltransferase [Solirubrobacteraceae bacterium]